MKEILSLGDLSKTVIVLGWNVLQRGTRSHGQLMSDREVPQRNSVSVPFPWTCCGPLSIRFKFVDFTAFISKLFLFDFDFYYFKVTVLLPII